MTFQAGQSGNPGGRRAEKPWRDALSIATKAVIEGDPTGRTKLRAVAEKLVEMAMAGDIPAAKEIGDRLDGKAVQALANEDGGPLQISIIRFTGDGS